MIFELPVDIIYYNDRFNCRGPISPESVSSLASLIKKQGLINAVTVRRIWPENGYDWQLIAGHRRFIAVRDILKQKTIRANMIDDCSDKQAYKINLSENLGRQQLHVGQELKAIEAAFGKNPNVKRVAQELGVSERWVTARLDIRKLHKAVQKDVERGILKIGDLTLLAGVPLDSQQALAKELAKAGRVRGKKEEIKKRLGKHKRGRLEIMDMMTRLMEEDRNPTWGRALAWAAGTITDEELVDSME
jgi:ParB/RepB/Spo0J family partition protein